MLFLILATSFLWLNFTAVSALSVSTEVGNAYAGPFEGRDGYARLRSPFDSVLDNNGNVYTINLSHFLTKTDSQTKETEIFAGANASGDQDGTGVNARFNSPRYLAFDGSDYIYLTDYNNNKIKRVNIHTAAVETFAGSSAGFANGPKGTARFNRPSGIAIDNGGNLYISDTSNRRIRMIDTNGEVTTYAGSGANGNTDGAAASARFGGPEGIAFDNQGNLIVVDRNYHRIRRVFDDNGTLSVETIAGSSAGDSVGPALSSQFRNPRDIAITNDGKIYITDTANHKIKVLNTDNTVDEISGNAIGYADGAAADAYYYEPSGITLKDQNNLLIADYRNNAIRELDLATAYSSPEVETIAGRNSAGNTDGAFGLNRLRNPRGIVKDSLGNFYIADMNNHRIRKLATDGTLSVFAGGSRGYTDSNGTNAQFNAPYDLVIDSSDNIYVADAGNHLIRQIDNAGNVSTYAGSSRGFNDGNGNTAQFNSPRGLEIDASGNLYVADYSNNRIRMIDTSQVVSTIAGSSRANSDGVGTNARFYGPFDICQSSSNTFYISDSYNHAIRKLQYSSGSWITTTLAGGLGSGFKDGKGAFALMYYPEGVACANDGSVYFSDRANHRVRRVDSEGNTSPVAGQSIFGFKDGSLSESVLYAPSNLYLDGTDLYLTDYNNHRLRKIDLSSFSPQTGDSGSINNGLKVSTYTGYNGSGGYRDGDRVFARFNSPFGIVKDSSGNFYVADRTNNRIRKIDTSGNVTTYAGSGARAFADGPASSASFYYPSDLAIDGSGNIYVADYGNHRIRRIDTSGNVTTFAGSGSGTHADGQGVAASFRNPTGLDIDSSGNIYVADYNNHRIRKIDSSANVTTIAGTSRGGYEDGTVSRARLNRPYDIAVRSENEIYISDSSNNRVRLVKDGKVTTYAGSGAASFKDGQGIYSDFRTPTYIDINSSGQIYISDTSNHRIRTIDTERNVSTLAGLGLPLYKDGSTSEAYINTPRGIYVDSSGEVYFSSATHRIRLISQETSSDDSTNTPIFISPGNTDNAPILELVTEVDFNEANSFTIRQGAALMLKVFAYDIEDEYKVVQSLEWISNQDGVLATATNKFDASALTLGTHNMKVSLNDSQNQSKELNFTLVVVASDADLDGNNGGADRNGDGVIDDQDRVLLVQGQSKKLIHVRSPIKGRKSRRGKLKAYALEVDNNDVITEEVSK